MCVGCISYESLCQYIFKYGCCFLFVICDSSMLDLFSDDIQCKAILLDYSFFFS